MANHLRGPELSYWTGDDASYQAMHWRLRSHRGKASDQSCARCLKPAIEWAYTHSGVKEKVNDRGLVYSTDPSAYQPMCRSCHRLFDATHKGQSRCGTDAGFYRHRRTGTQMCDECRLAHNAATLRRSHARRAQTQEIP